jgi:hypothetical protein
VDKYRRTAYGRKGKNEECIVIRMNSHKVTNSGGKVSQ